MALHEISGWQAEDIQFLKKISKKKFAVYMKQKLALVLDLLTWISCRYMYILYSVMQLRWTD